MNDNNRSNQLNPNNDAFWQSRGHSGRPDNWNSSSSSSSGSSSSGSSSNSTNGGGGSDFTSALSTIFEAIKIGIDIYKRFNR